MKINIYTANTEESVAHAGRGFVKTVRLLAKGATTSGCNFIDFTVVPPGSSIGLHRHAQSEEEYYLVLNGEGIMTVDGSEFPVSTGDLIRNCPGGEHALANCGVADIHLFVFEVPVPK
ncbi:cupin domain-containing protein [Sphingomonas sp. 28-63-12]|uniref:cupin domain-containing protein n=1 Tax=Sphingomonas sp. 28-63-12 TaxID=1970434 RepID=UPI000BC4F9AD|nr:MAG: hypothetical protein B7Y47_00045 [Sphingomonas sp. 28-63-12]